MCQSQLPRSVYLCPTVSDLDYG
ncbi:UNVERIFIED_CONTAM: hypothetical protein GTU68_059101 [Idotea baltica]|nr:hypothetical protein [Idotea baltica]